jgi:uncharacterized repeat protein (TIGR01451 family)
MSTITSIRRARRKRTAALVAAALAVATGALALTLGSAAPAGAAFPGGNGKIAFQSYRNGNYDIVVMNADGSAQTALTSSTDWEHDPAFSPDGSKIAYTRGPTTDRDDIWVMNADGTGQTDLTPGGPGNETDAAWSPDGTKIAFESNRNGNLEIWVMNADGSNPTNLTNSPGQDYEPAWSPDGSKIAFASYVAPQHEIFVMNADGSGQTNLTQDPGQDLEPSWSPDGRKIAFTSYRGDAPTTNQVYVMNADGSGQTNLSQNSKSDIDPSWSPDGSKIAFSRSENGEAEVYSMNADGSTQTNLTQSAGYDYSASWATAPSADLALGLVASPTVAKVQKPLTYTVKIDDVGPSSVFGAVVTDDLPAEQRFVSATSSQGSCQTPPVGTNGTITCSLGFLLQGHGATVDIVVKVVGRRSSVSNTASVASSTPDPNTSNNSATITTPVK